MKNHLLLCFSLILFAAPLSLEAFQRAQPQPKMNQNGPYQQEWAVIDSLEKQGLPRSALEKVEALYPRAQAEGEHAQFVKVLIYLNKYQSQLEEYGPSKAILRLEEEAAKAAFPIQPVLHSLIGELYQNFASQNEWRLAERTNIPATLPDDLNTWSLAQLQEAAAEHFLRSVSDERALEVPIADFAAITQPGSADADGLRPTLYDFLAHRAIDYFADARSYLSQPAYRFQMEQEEAFGPAASFVQLRFETPDTAANHLRALQLFQTLLSRRLAGSQTAALLDADLKRLNFVWSNSVLSHKDSLYLGALRELEGQYGGQPQITEIWHRIAGLFVQQGERYTPGSTADEKHKWKLKEALALCDKAIEAFSESYGAKHCMALRTQLLRQQLSLMAEEVNLPGKAALAIISYRNVPEAHLRVVQLTEDEYKNRRGRNVEEIHHALVGKKPVKSWKTALPNEGGLHEHRAEIGLDALPLGFYALLVSENGEFPYSERSGGHLYFVVSEMGYFNRRASEGAPEFLVLQRESGLPLEGVLAEFYTGRYNNRTQRTEQVRMGQATSGKDGIVRASLKDNTYFSVRLSKGADVLYFDDGYSSYGYSSTRGKALSTHFFMDRAIYRPGQAVYFKAVVLESDEKSIPSIVPGHRFTVTFYDANGKEASKLDLRTNEYGTANGIFTAPQSGLMGQMRLYSDAGNSSHYFSVEEYKRPKFELALDPLAGSPALGDTVKVSGKAMAYAGSAIDGADAAYRVVRQVRFPWWPWWRWGSRFPPMQGESQEIAAGVLKTDSEGKFELSFVALPDLSVSKGDNPEFVYTVYVDVTDLTGETRSGERSFSLAYIGLKAELSMPESIDRIAGPIPFIITTQNLDGEPQPAEGTVAIHRLQGPSRVFIDRYWDKPDQRILNKAEFERAFPHYAFADEDEQSAWAEAELVLGRPFQSQGKDTVAANPSRWAVGHYSITLKTQDDKGNPIELKRFFTVYDSRAKALPAGTLAWKKQTKNSPYKPGEQAEIALATAAKDLRLYYELERRGEPIARQWLRAAPWETVRYTVAEADKGNVFAHFSFARHNRAFSWMETIIVPWSDKELKIEYSTFRDKLAPGQEETWQLKISGPGNEKVAAEMAAALYDASLDQFRINSWQFSPFPYNSPSRAWRAAHFGATSLFGRYYYGPGFKDEAPQRSYRSLNWFDFYFHAGGFPMRYLSNEMVQMRAAPMPSAGAPAMDRAAMDYETYAPEEGDVVAKRGQKGGEEAEPVAAAEPEAPLQVRTNLNETVFFFPELRTDEEGNVIIRFTMNEALTRWKFLALAHTKDLKFALSENQVVTQKELMVMPNPPRFLREGDQIEFTAKVSNLTDKALAGSAQLLLFDALTMQPIDALLGNTEHTLPFKAGAGQSAPLAWKLTIPAGKVMAVTHRVIARAGDFSDGEESALPVLTNRTLVTEAMPMPLKGGETREFKFAAMDKAKRSKTLQHHSFTLEMTSNPAWYAVKALPYLMEFPYDCNEQVFSRYYANTLASSVANSSPAIKQVFERWKNLSPDALLSELEKNQELKALVLEETPWVRQAQSETEQRRRIGLLFDLNRMSYEQERALAQLSERQSAAGGFSWFPGGQDNWYITQYIFEGLGRLRALGAAQVSEGTRAWDIAANAAGFTSRKMAEHYEELQRRWSKDKEGMERDHLSSIAIHFLYARSLFPEFPLEGKAAEAQQYFLGQAEKYWLQKSLYEQAMLAVALQRSDRSKTAQAIVKSLRERALRHDELGMYWQYSSGYFWYEAPIETHAMMIEVFAEVAKDDQAVEQLKIWLLKNKQTTHWKTTKATANAVYALLRYGDNWLEGTELAQVSFPALDGKAYAAQLAEAQQAAEAGTGYYKASWQAEQLNTNFQHIKVSNPNKGIAWGAAYWQYFEDLDKVEVFEETPLKLSRQLFKEVIGDRGPELRAITATDPLRPGDKLTVRIELRADRDMEYVHLKDFRASGLEPINVLSQYKWQGGLGYYESTRDAATHFFFSYLPKGTYVFEYPLRVVHRGDFSNGISSIQCMYAPEFTSHSEGIRVKVE
jgi:uncharacterized protein YfaS (alpha-2-macroglobulin family)